MSLRAKLSLSYLFIVGLVVVVGVMAFVTSRRLRVQVSQLSLHSGFVLSEQSPVGLVLEVELEQDGDAWVAMELEELPAQRRPKLRGPIGGINSARDEFQMYGRTILTDSSTEYEPAAAATSLVEGLRAEVSIRIDANGQWIARKIRTGEIKPSDKVKGIVSAYRADGVWPDTLEISGISVLVGREKHWLGQPSRLHRLERVTEAGQLARRLQAELDQAAYDSLAWDAAAIRSAAGNLVKLFDASQPATLEGQSTQTNLSFELQAHARRLSASDLDAPGRANEIAAMRTILRDSVIPELDAQLLDARDEFAEDIREAALGTERTVKLVLVVSIAAVLLGIVLASYMGRSISRPIAALSQAAVDIGAGRLDTRVSTTSHDELGLLADSFNKMAEALAASTVSIDNLNAVKEKLRLSLTEKELLLREVHHRVKNNLQIVSSLLDLQAGRAGDPRVNELFGESRNRIHAMALVHEQFHQSSSSDRIDLGAYLRLLVTGLAQSLAPAKGALDMRVDLPDLRLDIDRTIACGLIVNELVTNAIKHALSHPGAKAVVSLARRDDGLCELQVSDDGPGMTAGSRDGSLGLDLVHALAGQLGGRVEIGNGTGTEIRIIFPADTEPLST